MPRSNRQHKYQTMFVDPAGNISPDLEALDVYRRPDSLMNSAKPLRYSFAGISSKVPPVIRVTRWITSRLKHVAGIVKGTFPRRQPNARGYGADRIQEAIAALEEAEHRFVGKGQFDQDGFDLAAKPIRKILGENQKLITEQLHKWPDATPRDWVYALLSNIAGDILESGRFHVYKGVLNPVSPGPALLRIYNRSMDELVKSKHIGSSYAESQKLQLRENMREVG